MNKTFLHRIALTSALSCLAIGCLGCGSPAESNSDAGGQDLGHDDAGVGDLGPADLGGDAGPFNALGPCDSDDDCDPTYACSFAPNGVRICIAVGTVEEGQPCGVPAEYQASRRCLRGSHCDYIQRESYAGLVCRRGCETYADCAAHESCIQEAFPGAGGLCVPSDCDFDAVLSGQAPNSPLKNPEASQGCRVA